MPWTLVPDGIAGAEAFGTPVVDGVRVDLGIASAEALGTPAVAKGIAPLLVTGIPSAEAFGSVTVTGRISPLRPSGIASGSAMGTPTISRGASLATGIDTLGSLGAGQPFPILPPQDLEPFPNTRNLDFDSPVFRRWFDKLQIRVRSQNQIHANQLQKGTLSLADIGNKQHNELDGLQGGTGTERHHWSVQEKLDEQVRHWITLEG